MDLNKIKSKNKDLKLSKSENFKLDSKIMNAVLLEADKLSELFLSEAIPNVALSDTNVDNIKQTFRSFFISITKSFAELSSLKDGNIKIDDSMFFVGTGAAGAIGKMRFGILGGKFLNEPTLRKEDFPDLGTYMNCSAIFYIQELLIRLYIKDRQLITNKALQISKKLQSETERLRLTSDEALPIMSKNRILITDINKARNSIIRKGKKLTFQQLAEEMGMNPNTLYSQLRKHNLKYEIASGIFNNYKTGEIN